MTVISLSMGNGDQFIGQGAFSGCIQMQSITLPFAGDSRTASGQEGNFGYIFGKDSYSGGMVIRQYFKQYYDAPYCIPNQLKEVTITDAVQLGYGAFQNCSMLKRLTVNSGAKSSVGDRAFEGCVKPKWN